jgi:acetyl-CoA carboxylase biotin carboxyl carrier protein
LNDPFSPLSDDEVRQIAQLVETLENSDFDFLQVEVGDLKLTLGKGDAPPPPAAAPQNPAAPAPAAPAPAPAAAPTPAPASADAGPAEDGSVAIASPLLGRFYAQSEPGADPFIKVGDKVGPETTVALIEVMKLFTTVPAGLSGTVTEICVANEEVVEYGQVLFRVKPS